MLSDFQGHPRLTNCLKRQNKLNKPEDYQQVFKSSLRFSDSTLLLLARQNGGKIARLGLAVSKKKINRAVGRNLVKRLIREGFRLNKNQLSGWDLVVITHRNLDRIDRQAVKRSLQTHFQALQRCKK